VKVNVLGVAPATIAEHGAVSEQTVRQLASGVRRVCAAECGIAISGIAGPGGGTAEKPVGTVWIAAETPDGALARRFHMFGGRSDIRERAAHAAIDMLRRALVGAEGA
jgi:nicotinamide-nucleotide amidase